MFLNAEAMKCVLFAVQAQEGFKFEQRDCNKLHLLLNSLHG